MGCNRGISQEAYSMITPTLTNLIDNYYRKINIVFCYEQACNLLYCVHISQQGYYLDAL